MSKKVIEAEVVDHFVGTQPAKCWIRVAAIVAVVDAGDRDGRRTCFISTTGGGGHLVYRIYYDAFEVGKAMVEQ